MIYNFIFNFFSQGLLFGSRWLFNVFMAKLLLVSDYAFFSFIYSIANFSSSLLSFGSELYILKEKVKKNIVYESVFISFFSFLILVLIVLFFNFKSINFVIYGLILGFFFSIIYIISSYFKSLGDFKKEFFNIIIYFLFILLSSCIIYIFNIKVLFEIILIFAFAHIAYIIYLIIRYKFIFWNKKNLLLLKVSSYKKRLYYGLHSLVSAIYSQAGSIILFYLLSKEEYRTYKIFFLVIMPFILINNSLYQFLIVSFKKYETINEKMLFFRRILSILLIFALLLYLIGLKLKLYIFNFFNLNFQYYEIFNIFLFIPIIQLINVSYSALLTHLGYQNVRFYSTLISALLTVMAMIIFIRGNNNELMMAFFINVIGFLCVFVINFLYTEIILIRRINKC